MLKEWLNFLGTLLSALLGTGGVVGFLIKYYFDRREKLLTDAKAEREKLFIEEKTQQEKQRAAASTTEVARIEDNNRFREQIWREGETLRNNLSREIDRQQAEIVALRKDIDEMDERHLRQVEKNAECEHRSIAQEARLQVFERQNTELLKALIAANPAYPAAMPIVLKYEADGENIG